MGYVITETLKGTVLEKILADKLNWLESHKAKLPLKEFEATLTPSNRDFYHAFNKNQTQFILECKKASPSKGLIRESFDIEKIALTYQSYASVISVLTDEPYFQGDYHFLPKVSGLVKQPILCKDFIIDGYQIKLARHFQADAILLMLSILDDQQYKALESIAHELSMGILTEVSNETELQRAINLGAKVIGINNRDLRDLSVDLSTSLKLAPTIPNDRIIISESGIRNYSDVRRLAKFVDGFLIGSALMAEDDLEGAIKKIILGANKVCGLTRAEDAKAAFDAGAIFGGLIFVQNTPRHINTSQAKNIIAGAPLAYVGVFRNDNIDHIASVVKELNLSAVQLHGHENQAYVTMLRKKLPLECQIWKALSIEHKLPERDWEHVDKYVFDHGPGGSGQTFDWAVFKGHENDNLNNVLLAGGLSPDNCKQAAEFYCGGLDFNSGVENKPALKDADKIRTVFTNLRDY
ncbi:bifunctional indole-3-glycerol-phosphate synthase TrpC/phosphoribosylanthranilate isomerase TrpF [Thorsellia anophelis]|uniref:Multifunctional fusion protein n=1 Tax=Thorsellia anophelis DSM 18579 TaxID=1123402 RepID=A0A1I0ET21_9GAMM|nr:bifunctional indole-3-glycerol-phosphate synthase TrpC/phosphoribosylanthranilate isomerase TrpF [Thorsellia anophelis]SET48701.1 indole-3-glycerol phosphate synthase [Thorsellia anophelis DSM 18579]